ncbi:MAG: hypothetical protein AB7O57_12190 [Hyphomicrobiaceae bacterium]
MDGVDLAELIEGFLAADGRKVERPAPHAFAATRTQPGSAPAPVYVWFRDPANGIDPGEADLGADFAAAKNALGTDAQAYFVTPSLAGLSAALRQQASAVGVQVRVPVQFFDTVYKAESGQALGAGLSASASRALSRARRRGEVTAAQRVPQPFVALSGLGDAPGGLASGDDLLPRLIDDLSAAADGPRLTLVLGKAGAGKTFLLDALYAALHARFTEAKQAQRMAARPLPFTPASIRRERTAERDEDHRIVSFDGLLDAVARTEGVAGATPIPMMRFLNRAGLSLWFVDGLDEFFAGDGDFLGEIEAALAPGSRARIVLSTRNSLLTSSTALSGLVERHIGQGTVRLYELSDWERPSQRALAWLRRTGKLPSSPAAADPPAVAAFLSVLDLSRPAAELAALPFYCDLMLGLEPAAEGGPKDEHDLLTVVVDGLIDREAEKLGSGDTGFQWDVFSGAEGFVEAASLVEAFGAERFATAADREQLFAALVALGRERLVELIEGIAHKMRMSEPYPNEGRGLSTEEIEDLANVYLDVGLDPALEPRVLLAVVQLAFFAPGDSQGTVRFAHEIVADFLAARHALAMIRGNPASADALSQALGVRRDLDGSIVLATIVRGLAAEPAVAVAVRDHIEADRVRDRSRDAARQLLAAMDGARI